MKKTIVQNYEILSVSDNSINLLGSSLLSGSPEEEKKEIRTISFEDIPRIFGIKLDNSNKVVYNDSGEELLPGDVLEVTFIKNEDGSVELRSIAKLTKTEVEYLLQENNEDFPLPQDSVRSNIREDLQFPEVDEYLFTLGTSTFFIPPTAIQVDRVKTSVNLPALRNKGSIKRNAGRYDTRITLTLFFNGLDQINDEDHGLRALIAQFTKTPFVPVRNRYLNITHGILAVCLHDLSVTTLDNFPNTLVANITLYQFDFQVYMPQRSTFEIIEPLYKWHYKRNLISGENPKLKPIKERTQGLRFLYADTSKIDAIQKEKYMANFTGIRSQQAKQNKERIDAKNDKALVERIINEELPKFLEDTSKQELIEKGKFAILRPYELSYDSRDPMNVKTIYGGLILPEENSQIRAIIAIEFESPLNVYKGDGTFYKLQIGHSQENARVIEDYGFEVCNNYFGSKLKVTALMVLVEDKDSGSLMLTKKSLEVLKSVESAEEASQYELAKINTEIKRLEMTDYEISKNMELWPGLEDAIITRIHLGRKNSFSRLPIEASSVPVYQYLGSQDCYIKLDVEVTSEESAESLRMLFDTTCEQAKRVRFHTTAGVLKLDLDVVNLFGIEHVLIESLTFNTVPNFPGRYLVEITLVDFDVLQAERERGLKIAKEGDDYVLRSFSEDDPDNPIVAASNDNSQSFRRYVEWSKVMKMMKYIDLYPDLDLPMYNEVNSAGLKLNGQTIVLKPERDAIYVDPDFYIYTGKTFIHELHNELGETVEALLIDSQSTSLRIETREQDFKATELYEDQSALELIVDDDGAILDDAPIIINRTGENSKKLVSSFNIVEALDKEFISPSMSESEQKSVVLDLIESIVEVVNEERARDGKPLIPSSFAKALAFTESSLRHFENGKPLERADTMNSLGGIVLKSYGVFQIFPDLFIPQYHDGNGSLENNDAITWRYPPDENGNAKLLPLDKRFIQNPGLYRRSDEKRSDTEILTAIRKDLSAQRYEAAKINPPRYRPEYPNKKVRYDFEEIRSNPVANIEIGVRYFAHRFDLLYNMPGYNASTKEIVNSRQRLEAQRVNNPKVAELVDMCQGYDPLWLYAIFSYKGLAGQSDITDGRIEKVLDDKGNVVIEEVKPGVIFSSIASAIKTFVSSGPEEAQVSTYTRKTSISFDDPFFNSEDFLSLDMMYQMALKDDLTFHFPLTLLSETDPDYIDPYDFIDMLHEVYGLSKSALGSIFFNEVQMPLESRSFRGKHGDQWHDMKKYSHKGRMTRAFPTFHMFIIDEGRWIGWARLWDNFYGTNAVSSIEVHKNRKIAADTVTMVMSNQYKYFTNSMSGEVYSRDKYKFNFRQLVFPHITQEIIETRSYAVGSIFMSPGCRIHLRMGYGNNLSELPVMFNGTITEVEVGDIVQIVAQSDAIELTNKLKFKDETTTSGTLNFGAEPKNILEDLLFRGDASWTGETIAQISGFRRLKGRRSDHPVIHFGDPLVGNWFVSKGSEMGQNIYPGNGSGVREWQNGWAFAGGSSDETNIQLILGGKSIWDVGQVLAAAIPNYVCAVRPFEFRSTLFYGKPYWDIAYEYDLIPRSVYRFDSQSPGEGEYIFGDLVVIERKKAFSQWHIYDSLSDIISNKIKASSEGMYTNVVARYKADRPGLIKVSTTDSQVVAHADRDIYPNIQKTTVIDSELYAKAGLFRNVLALSLVSGAVSSVKAWTHTANVAFNIAASNVKDYMKDMYQGQLLVLGDPTVNPYDIMYIGDIQNEMFGTCYVGAVTHTMSIDTGFVTSIKPDAAVSNLDQGEETSWIVGGAIASSLIVKTITSAAAALAASVEAATVAGTVVVPGILGTFIAPTVATTALSWLGTSLGVIGGAPALVLIPAVYIVGMGISGMIRRYFNGAECVSINLLQFQGREFSAGINGHRGIIVGTSIGTNSWWSKNSRYFPESLARHFGENPLDLIRNPEEIFGEQAVGFMDELAKFQYIKDRSEIGFYMESSLTQRDKEEINLLIATGSKIVQSAAEAYKVPYLEGGRDPKVGLDDIGLVLFALENRGYKVPYNSVDEFVNDEYGLFSSTLPWQTESEDLQAGDIIILSSFYNTYFLENPISIFGIVVDPVSKLFLTTRVQRPISEDGMEKETGYVELLRWDKKPFNLMDIRIGKRIIHSSYEKYAEKYLEEGYLQKQIEEALKRNQWTD